MPIRPDMKDRYPKNWPGISRRIRYVRAQNRCEGCGVANGSTHPETGAKVVLTVGHVNHVPEDCSEGNLKAWCQLCHNRHDMLHRQRGRRERERAASGQHPFAFDTYGQCARCDEVCDLREPCPCCGASPGRPQ